jgi:hypothetical protein
MKASLLIGLSKKTGGVCLVGIWRASYGPYVREAYFSDIKTNITAIFYERTKE